MIRAIKKWLQYRRIVKFHTGWISYFVWSQNFRKAHIECEKLRKVRCIWKRKPYHFMPYSFVIQRLDPEGYDILSKLGVSFD